MLDTLPEEDYDNINKLVTNICAVPVALITMHNTTRNFFKSHHGIPFQELPRNISFCGHAILCHQNIFIIEDARLDDRFVDNPLIDGAGVIFYAGVPLINPEGFFLIIGDIKQLLFLKNDILFFLMKHLSEISTNLP